MNAVTEPTNFTLPKKPRVKEQEAPPDQRKFCVIPFRASTDANLTLGMMRTLILICAYCNRAGITWVSQARLAKDLNVSQQAISKHLVKLTKAGYLEVMKRSVPGKRMTTWRVIFGEGISAQDAISLTSAMEDTRPPFIKEQEMEDMTPDPAGQRKVAQLIAKALKSTSPKPKEYTMPEGNQTMTVKKMKAEIASKKKPKSSPKGSHTQPPEVVPANTTSPVDNSVHIQPPEVVKVTTSRGCVEHTKNTGIEVIKEYLKEDCLIQLHNNGLSDEVIADNLSILLETYRAEGLTPKPDQLVQDIIQLSKV